MYGNFLGSLCCGIFSVIELNLERAFKLQPVKPVKPVNSQMAILLKQKIMDEEK